MSLRKTTLHFSSPAEAEHWFSQLRTQWVVTATSIVKGTMGWYDGTAEFDVKDGHLVAAPPSAHVS